MKIVCEIVFLVGVCAVGCVKVQHNTLAVPGKFPNLNKVRAQYDRRILLDPKFKFLAQIPLPKASFNNIGDVNFLIVNVGNYGAAYSIALDSYSRFRLQVMDYILKLKMNSLRLGDHESDQQKVLMFKGIIFDIITNAQKHLTAYHEQRIKIFTDFFNQLTRTHPKDRTRNAKLITTKLRRTLLGYESKMKKMKGAIRSSLALLYAIRIAGV